jgi:hypothetical protein
MMIPQRRVGSDAPEVVYCMYVRLLCLVFSWTCDLELQQASARRIQPPIRPCISLPALETWNLNGTGTLLRMLMQYCFLPLPYDVIG